MMIDEWLETVEGKNKGNYLHFDLKPNLEKLKNPHKFEPNPI